MSHLIKYSILFACTISILPAFPQFNTDVKKHAIQFLDSLSNLQKKRIVYSINDTARIQWTNLPVGLRARAGVSLSALSEGQRKAFHRLLSASLSSQGYLKVTSIMQLDNLLNILYDTLHRQKKISEADYKMIRNLDWNFTNYYTAFFGDPLYNDNWGFKIEGHHLSLNFTFSGNQSSVTPLFVGSDPAEYPILEYAGLRLLGEEEDLGLKLINNLTTQQRDKARKDTAVPSDIILSAESGKRLLDKWGISGAELSPANREILKGIVREFVFNLPYDKAVQEYEKILKAGIDKIFFGWIGSFRESEPHYYVLNGPTFIIEFDNFENHIHAIWREKGNEYGEDYLKKHYLQSKH